MPEQGFQSGQDFSARVSPGQPILSTQNYSAQSKSKWDHEFNQHLHGLIEDCAPLLTSSAVAYHSHHSVEQRFLPHPPRMYFKNVVEKKYKEYVTFSGNTIFHEGNLKAKVTEFQANRHRYC